MKKLSTIIAYHQLNFGAGEGGGGREYTKGVLVLMTRTAGLRYSRLHQYRPRPPRYESPRPRLGLCYATMSLSIISDAQLTSVNVFLIPKSWIKMNDIVWKICHQIPIAHTSGVKMGRVTRSFFLETRKILSARRERRRRTDGRIICLSSRRASAWNWNRALQADRGEACPYRSADKTEEIEIFRLIFAALSSCCYG